MNVKTTIAFVAITAAISAEELPRKTSAPRESYPNVDVIYDSVARPDGKRLRTIITKPHNAKEKLPVIFVAGWLSCDSVEAPAGTKDESGLVFRGLAKLPEFALFRMDKQGVGDSEGVCAETDFDAELAGYRAAFRALKNYDFIDTKKNLHPRHKQRRRVCAARSRNRCRTGAGSRLHFSRRLGEDLV